MFSTVRRHGERDSLEVYGLRANRLVHSKHVGTAIPEVYRVQGGTPKPIGDKTTQLDFYQPTN